MNPGVKQSLAALCLVTILAMPSIGQREKSKAAEHSRFEQFKQLAGEWVGTTLMNGKPGKEMHVRYKVASGESAVVETIFPDAAKEMVTVIHRDPLFRR